MIVSSLRTCVFMAVLAAFLSGCGDRSGAPAPSGRSFKNVRLGDTAALDQYLRDIELDIDSFNQLEIQFPTDYPLAHLGPRVIHVVPRASGTGVDSLIRNHPDIKYTASILYLLLAPLGQSTEQISESGLTVSPLSPGECRTALHGVFLSYIRLDKDVVHKLFPSSEYLQGERQILVSLETMEGLSLNRIESLKTGFVVHSVSMMDHDAVSSEGVDGYKSVTVDCVRVSMSGSSRASGGAGTVTEYLRSLKPRAELMLAHWKSMDTLNTVFHDPAKRDAKEYVRHIIEMPLLPEHPEFYTPNPLSKPESVRPQFAHAVLRMTASLADESLMVYREPLYMPALLLRSYEYVMMHAKGASLAGGHVLKREVLTDSHCRASLDGVFLYAPALHNKVHLPLLFPELVDPSNTGFASSPSARWPSPLRARVLMSTRLGESIAKGDAWQKSKGLVLVAIDLDSTLVVPGTTQGIGGVLSEAKYASALAFCVRLSPAYGSDGKEKQLSSQDQSKIRDASKVALFKTFRGAPLSDPSAASNPSRARSESGSIETSSPSAGGYGLDASSSKLDLSFADIALLPADALNPAIGSSDVDIEDDFMLLEESSDPTCGAPVPRSYSFPSDIADPLNLNIDIFAKEALKALTERLDFKSLYLNQREPGSKGATKDAGMSIESVRLIPSPQAVPVVSGPLVMFGSSASGGPVEVADDQIVSSSLGSAGRGQLLQHQYVYFFAKYARARVARHMAGLTEAASKQKLQVKLVDGKAFLQQGLFIGSNEVSALGLSFLTQFSYYTNSRLFDWSQRPRASHTSFLLPLSEVESSDSRFRSSANPRHLCLLLSSNGNVRNEAPIVESQYAFFCFEVRALSSLLLNTVPTSRLCPAQAAQPLAAFTGDSFKKEDVEKFVDAVNNRAVYNHLVENPSFSTETDTKGKRYFYVISFRLEPTSSESLTTKPVTTKPAGRAMPLIVSSASSKLTSLSLRASRSYGSERVTEYMDDILRPAFKARKVHVARIDASSTDEYEAGGALFFSMGDWDRLMHEVTPDRFTDAEFASEAWQKVLGHDKGTPLIPVSELESYISPNPDVRAGPKTFCFLLERGPSVHAVTEVVSYEAAAVDCFQVTVMDHEVAASVDISKPSAEISGPIDWKIDAFDRAAVQGLVSLLERRRMYQLWKADHDAVIEDYSGKPMSSFTIHAIQVQAPAPAPAPGKPGTPVGAGAAASLPGGTVPELKIKLHDVNQGHFMLALEEYGILLEDLVDDKADDKKSTSPRRPKYTITPVDNAPFLAAGLFCAQGLTGIGRKLMPGLYSKEEYSRRGWAVGRTSMYLPLLDADLHISTDPSVSRAPRHVCFLLEEKPATAKAGATQANLPAPGRAMQCYSITIPNEVHAQV